MSLTNQWENRILTVINLAVFAAVVWLLVLPGYNARIASLERQNKAKDETIVELAKIAKYAITNQYDKIKTTDGSTVNLNLDNTMQIEGNSATQTTNKSDTVHIEQVKDERGFFKRIFGGKEK